METAESSEQARSRDFNQVRIGNEYVTWVIAENGTNLHFIDGITGRDYCAHVSGNTFARVKRKGVEFVASKLTCDGGRLTIHFGGSGVVATVDVRGEERYMVLRVASVVGEGVEEFTFLDLQLTTGGHAQDPFAGCVLALNLKTDVPELHGSSRRLRAKAYARFGFAGAAAAVIGCPGNMMREAMKEVVNSQLELPRSPIGGPFALDHGPNRGSYLFNFGDLSESRVEDWIHLARSIGITQIDFHGGKSFRFGDCRPDPDTYPRGFASMRQVTDRLHSAGILAGLHTYAFFIDKRCPWVTPVPDPRLAKDATFTLAEEISAETRVVPVVESTAAMSNVTGFFVRNSVTLQIDDELITYQNVSKEVPCAFTGCVRGACGTLPAAHSKGAKVHHLKECFGLFVPDGESSLFSEVAARTAQAFNEGGFDMIYLDALDGEDVVGGAENGWHYGSKFVFEVFGRLRKPAIMEMSTFHHHLWYVRSRMGAWDHPTRSHKKFIDIHVQANQANQRTFLPGHLGWWAFKTWSGPQGEPTYPDDVEYLCCKCIGTDVGLSVMAIDPGKIGEAPALERLASVVRAYEEVRLSGQVPEAVKARLRMPGKEFTLTKERNGRWAFAPVQYWRHKVEGLEDGSDAWTVFNRFGKQPARLRIEALMGVGPYDGRDRIILADFGDPSVFEEESEQGVTVGLTKRSEKRRAWVASGIYRAENGRRGRRGAWARIRRTFSPPLDLSGHEGMGAWVYGDGRGEVLNFQLRSPSHLVAGIGEHYVVVDFKGWRYFELVEPEGHRYADYRWPYGDPYSIYRESADFRQIESLSIWYNDLPRGRVECRLGPVHALPLAKIGLRNPSITIGKRKIVFPVQIESGSYLEFASVDDCRLYGPKGGLLDEVTPAGGIPTLKWGLNKLRFSCEIAACVKPRACVTTIAQGNPLGTFGAPYCVQPHG